MDDIFLSVFKGKNVLVTGHTGFSGSWLSLWLSELGARVIGYSLDPPTKPNLFDAIGLKNQIESHIIGDIRDYDYLKSIFQKYQPVFAFHLAAQPLVRLSYREPRLTYETNVTGTVNVLEAVRKTKSVKVCVIVTSDKCYENKGWIYGYREIDPMGGYDPYSSSKGCAELVTTAYRRSFFNPKEYGKTHTVVLSSVRAGNMIGGGDWGEDRIIPDCVRALSEGRAIIIRNPTATRPWQYVLEPLSGYLWLGALMYRDGTKYSGAWNFGPNGSDTLTVEGLVGLLLNEWGNGEYEIRTDGLHEAHLLRLDTSKANSMLKWKPVYDIHSATKETAVWHKTFFSNGVESIHNFTVSQIDKYVRKAKTDGSLWAKEV